MQFVRKLIIALTVFLGIITFAQSETSWIKKKDNSKKVEKVASDEKKSSWIKKKKVKENKKEYKKEEKNITKEIKSWITKKSQDKYIKSIDKLPDGAIYFTGASETKDLMFYGYVIPDTSSKLINGYYETSKGFGFFDDGKTTCKIGSTVLVVIDNEVTARVSGECTNGIKFAGKTSQTKNSGWGSAKTSDGKHRLNFDFNISKFEIAKIYDENLNKSNEETLIARKISPKQKRKIKLEPNGKYYALLIGNSTYDDKGWDQLVSPENDINEIEKVLNKSYKFEEIITVKSGTKKDIFNAFKKLAKLTTTNDYVLIYYSGHGKTKAQQAYWIPRDGSLEWGNGDWININELNIFLTEIKAHHLAVMVDSCYVGGKFKGTNILDLKQDDDLLRSWNENLKDELNLRSRSVLSSGTTGRVSDTVGDTNHSQFALAFLNILKIADKESVPLNMLNIAINVRNAFAGNFNQKPYYYHPDTWQHGGGDFIFIPKKNLK